MDTEAPGPLIGTGRAADVYDIGDGRVLRRNRDGSSTAREAAVMESVRRQGYPVPEVFDAEGGDIVMARVDGETMLGLLPRRPWRVRSWARLLARLHHELAVLAPPDLELPARFGPPEALLHLDLHPDNVMITADGPMVIDWANASVGPAGAEVAGTWLVLHAAVAPGSRIKAALADAMRTAFLRPFLDDAGRDSARPWLDEVGRHRCEDRNMRPVEIARMQALVAAESR